MSESFQPFEDYAPDPKPEDSADDALLREAITDVRTFKELIEILRSQSAPLYDSSGELLSFAEMQSRIHNVRRGAKLLTAITRKAGLREKVGWLLEHDPDQKDLERRKTK